MKLWQLKFPFYVNIYSTSNAEATLTSTYRLGVISYWIIRFIHGHSELRKMAEQNLLKHQDKWERV